MFKLGGLLGILAVSIVWYFADWGFYVAMPPPADFATALKPVSYAPGTEPNPLLYFFMELGGALVLALACLQVPLSVSQAAKNGALSMLGVWLVLNVSLYMWLNVPWTASMMLVDVLFRLLMGAIGGALMVTVANKFNK